MNKEQLEKILPKTDGEAMKISEMGLWIMSMAIANKMVEMGIFADLNAFADYSKEQGENKRNNIIIEYNGEKHCITYWARIINKSRKFINNRLKKGIPFDKIFKEASGLT